MSRGRGQAHTLEGVIAGIVLLSGLVFALQATAVTPLSASTSSQHIENQLEASAEGALAAADSGPPGTVSALKKATLFWDTNGDNGDGGFYNSDNEGFYTSTTPSNRLGEALSRSFDSSGVAYNVYVVYTRSDGSRIEQRMIYRGEPSDNAVSASRLVTLYNDDDLYHDNDGDGVAEPTEAEISESTFYMSDVSDSELYNVVEVEVIAWRM